MEKIKDFFHDFSDIFFAIAVASIMFIVLSWNLGSWFDNSADTVLADEIVNIVEENNDQTVTENKDEIDPAIEEPGAEESNTEDLDEGEILPEETENSQDKDTTESGEEEKEPDHTESAAEIKTIVIPNGTPGSGVARILKENGLIEDTQSFIQTAENLNLAIRLKSGTFEIPTNSTIEDMVKIIAGQKR